jgi:hypothetical protein
MAAAVVGEAETRLNPPSAATGAADAGASSSECDIRKGTVDEAEINEGIGAAIGVAVRGFVRPRRARRRPRMSRCSSSSEA